ncbi:MAG TPA: hypothetical protein VGK71_07875 [Nitrospirota bacterium]
MEGILRAASSGLSKAARVSAFLALLLAAVSFLAGCATTGSQASAAPQAVTAVAASAAAMTSGVRGVVSAPMEGAYIFVYEKGADPHGPPFSMSKPTGPDGSFEMGLPDGEYTVVARKHKSGQPGSPLSKDEDQKSMPVDVTVKGGLMKTQSLVMVTKTDDIKYFDQSVPSETSISGKILDSEGNPMKSFRVHVYTYAQMSERPKYVSNATGADGRYTIYLPKGGTYYLAARDNFGAPPKIGDFFGRFDEGTIDPSGVILRTGQRLDNINITVHKVW